jgi:ABC-type lipoprotein export system ATPase subunit
MAEKHEAILRVENLSKTFAIPDGRLQILQNIHLQVQRGEFLAITGPSGQTVIMVTHDPELAALADRHIHLEQLHRTETKK